MSLETLLPYLKPIAHLITDLGHLRNMGESKRNHLLSAQRRH